MFFLTCSHWIGFIHMDWVCLLEFSSNTCRHHSLRYWYYWNPWFFANLARTIILSVLSGDEWNKISLWFKTPLANRVWISCKLCWCSHFVSVHQLMSGLGIWLKASSTVDRTICCMVWFTSTGLVICSASVDWLEVLRTWQRYHGFAQILECSNQEHWNGWLLIDL